MRFTVAVAALAAAVHAIPQGVTSAIAPSASAPAGCSASAPGSFQITVVNVTAPAKRSIAARDVLTLTLDGGILKDQVGRIGYIASNYQFQFDGPPQAGAIYTAGFSLCSNGSLALGGSTIFYQCLSGDFYNLYDRHWAAQCSPIYIQRLGGGGSTGPVTQIPDGQPQGGQPITQIGDGQVQNPTGMPAVSQIGDGQIQAPTGNPVSQIGDGQIQAPTGNPVSQIGDGQIQAPTGNPVSQIGDGQIQAPTGLPVSQIADGQPQAPTGKPVSQIADGQPQAPKNTGKPVSQIADGQPQAPKVTGNPVSQIGDGQVQAPATTTGKPVSQIGDGQVQAPVSATKTTVPVAQFTGAAATAFAAPIVAVAGFVAAVAIL